MYRGCRKKLGHVCWGRGKVDTASSSAAYLAFFRWGGYINGALWTIPVEILFYCLIAVAWPWLKTSKRNAWIAFIICDVLWGVSHTLVEMQLPYTNLLASTPIPYLYIFCLGIVIYQYREEMQVFALKKKGWVFAGTTVVLIGYIVGCLLLPGQDMLRIGRYGVLRGLFVPASIMLLGQAACVRIRHDYTYLMYLLHMLVICSINQFNIQLASYGLLVGYSTIVVFIFCLSFILIHAEEGVHKILLKEKV